MPYTIVKRKSGSKTTCRVRTENKIDGKYKYFSKKGIPCARAERQKKLLYAIESGNYKPKRKSQKRRSGRK